VSPVGENPTNEKPSDQPVAVEGGAPAAPAGPDDRELLEERGEVAPGLVDIAARDVDRTDGGEEALAKARERKPATFYSDLIYTLANIRYAEDEARLLWVSLVTHKAELSEILGRNVGIRVAALDFFRNVVGTLGDVKIVDSSHYVETARLAVTDGLTHVYNHRYFHDRLERAVNRAKRDKTPLSVIMMDIDLFKKYNDVNGHTAGDIALREVAAALGRVLRKEDILARYGGEEFAVILSGQGNAEALAAGERLRRAVQGLAIPVKGGDPEASLTISVGVAACPGATACRDELIECADLALYLAKTGGRNRVVSCPPDRKAAERVGEDLDARLSLSGSNEWRPVHVADLGPGGLTMLGDGLPSTGTRVKVRLTCPEGPLFVRGRVLWRRHESCLGELAGVSFIAKLRAETRRRLAELVRSRCGRRECPAEGEGK